MGRKAGKYKKKESNAHKKGSIHEEDDDMMNDEIDAFHKQRDIVPLDLNEDAEESDEDNEVPVFNLEDDKDEEDDIEDDTLDTGFTAKIVKQQKYLRAKLGGIEDGIIDDEAEDKQEKRSVWGRNKNLYYNADNVDYELQSSDEEDPEEEEKEVVRLQKEKALSMTAADFGLEDDSEHESDGEPTIGELVSGKLVPRTSSSKEAKDDPVTVYEKVKKDLNSLTTEEKMDIVYSSAPELVGLLSELNDAVQQLEDKVNPFLVKIKERDNVKEELKQYMEVKQLLLLSYCQAITFYLLLKSEGQLVRDHPVISRLVEIKNLLDKMKKLDVDLPPKFEDVLNETRKDERVEMQMETFSLSEAHVESDEKSEKQKVKKALEASEFVEDDSLKVNKSKFEHEEKQVGMQSLEMLKVRAALEEKLKLKGVFNSMKKHNGSKKRQLPLNEQLETWDDFDDDAREDGSLLHQNKLSKLVAPRTKKAKVTAGDDDLPKRDDIGERRRKYELRVLAGAGVKSVDGVEDESEAPPSDGDADEDMNAESDSGVDAESDSDLEFYKQVEQKHAAKLAAKAEMYSRPAKVPSMPETPVDGKRHISYQMEKNRGLTRSRNKLTKNPRKKYRTKHQKAVVRRKGQVRDFKKPTGPYGGESSGINPGISCSIRF